MDRAFDGNDLPMEFTTPSPAQAAPSPVPPPEPGSPNAAPPASPDSGSPITASPDAAAPDPARQAKSVDAAAAEILADILPPEMLAIALAGGPYPDTPYTPGVSASPTAGTPAASTPAASTPPPLARPLAPGLPVVATRVSSPPPLPVQLPPDLAYLLDLDRGQLWALLDEGQAATMKCLLRGDAPIWAAANAKVSRSSVYRWQRQPLFAAIYQILKHHALADARDDLQLLSPLSIRVLKDALEGNNLKIASNVALRLLERLGMFGRRE